MKLQNFQRTYSLALIMLLLIVLLSSCSGLILVNDNNRWLVKEISGIGDFFKVFFIFHLSILLLGVLLGFELGKLGYVISLIINFILIIYYRDYGFLNVLLLFGSFFIGSFLYNLYKSRKNDYY